MDRVEILLEQAQDEDDVEFQRDLAQFYRALLRERVRASGRPFAGIQDHLPSTFVLTLAPATIAGVTHVLATWIKARYGRKMRFKVGDKEAEAGSIEEIKALLNEQFNEEKKPSDREQS